jgi:hypothetical protein
MGTYLGDGAKNNSIVQVLDEKSENDEQNDATF